MFGDIVEMLQIGALLIQQAFRTNFKWGANFANFYTNLLFTNEVLTFGFYVLTHHAVFNEVM